MEISEPVQACTGIGKRNSCLIFKIKSKRKNILFKLLGSAEEGRNKGNYRSNDSINANRTGSVVTTKQV
jgi:hypothetical protein